MLIDPCRSARAIWARSSSRRAPRRMPQRRGRAPGATAHMPTASESVDVDLKASAAGGDLTLVTWAGGARAVEPAAEDAYGAIDSLLRERGCVPVQERVFGDLQAAAAVARGRARAVGSAAEWAVPPTCVEGAPVGRTGLAGIHVIGARGTSRPLAEGDRVYGRVVETPSARVLGPLGRRAPRLGPARRGPGRGCRRGDRRGGGPPRAGGLLLPRRGAHLVLPARHPRLVRAVQRGPQRRLPADGPRGAGRGRADPRQHRDRGAQRPRRVVRARPPGGRGRRRRRRGDAPAPQPEAERGDRVRVGVRPRDGGRARRRALRLRLGHGLDRRSRRGRCTSGDFETQARYTLEAVQALLEGAGARLADVGQATAFLANPCDGRSFERIVERSEIRDAPLVTTVADVCRGDLLFELDATAVVPLARGVRR